MAGLRSRFDSSMAQGSSGLSRGPRKPFPEMRVSLQKGTSWNTVSNNVKRLVREWETAGRIGRRRPATRKQAIDLAVAAALKMVERTRRSRNH